MVSIAHSQIRGIVPHLVLLRVNLVPTAAAPCSEPRARRRGQRKRSRQVGNITMVFTRGFVFIAVAMHISMYIYIYIYVHVCIYIYI